MAGRTIAMSRTLEVWAMEQSVLPPSQQVQAQAMAVWAMLDAEAPRHGRRLARITIELAYDEEPGHDPA